MKCHDTHLSVPGEFATLHTPTADSYNLNQLFFGGSQDLLFAHLEKPYQMDIVDGDLNSVYSWVLNLCNRNQKEVILGSM